MKLGFRPPVSVVGFLGLTALAHAQAPLFNSYDSHRGLLLPAAWGDAYFTRTTVGEFTGEGLLDVVTISNSRPLISWNIAVHSFEQLLPNATTPLQVKDIDTYKNGANPGRDAIAFVNDDGLGYLAFSESTQAFVTQMLPNDVNNPVWLGAHRLSCGYIDADSFADFAGVSANQQKVFWRLGEYGADQIISTGAVVLDVALVHWSSSTSKDLAVLTQTGIRVYATSGALQGQIVHEDHPGTSTTGVTFAIIPADPDLPSGLESIAVIYATSSPVSRQLQVYGYEAPFEQTWSELQLPANMTFVGLAAGDGDGDGDFDLVMAQKRELGPLYLANAGNPTPSFTAPGNPPGSNWNANFIIDHHFDPLQSASAENDPLRAPSAANNESVPVFADFTDDGRADLALALPITPVGLLKPAHIFLENKLPAAPLVSLHFMRDGALFAIPGSTGNQIPLGGYVTFTTDIPAFDVNKANAVRVTVHRQADFDTEAFELSVSESVTSVQSIVNATNFDTQRPDIAIAIQTQLSALNEWITDPSVNTVRREIFWVEVQPVKITYNTTTLDYTILQSWTTRLSAIVSDSRDVCDYVLEEDFPNAMYGWTVNCPYGSGWTAVTQTNDTIPGTCLNPEVSPGGELHAPAIIGRRRLPPGAAGTWEEYPSDTYMSGEASSIEPISIWN